jgi:hypothetical protein
LTKEQKHALNRYYAKDPNWRRTTILSAAKELRIPYTKVYKWGYDMRRKVIKKI